MEKGGDHPLGQSVILKRGVRGVSAVPEPSPGHISLSDLLGGTRLYEFPVGLSPFLGPGSTNFGVPLYFVLGHSFFKKKKNKKIRGGRYKPAFRPQEVPSNPCE